MINRIVMLLCCATLGFAAMAQQQAKKGKLKIVITNPRSQDGRLLLSMHNKKEGFPGDTAHSILTRALKITGDTLEFEFIKLPYGEYAVAVFHDENGNLKMDTNMFGIPKEGIGISNNAYRMMGPPYYDEARFELNTPEKVIYIKMHYY